MSSILTWMNLDEADKPYFVVDTTALSVPVTIPASPFLKTAGGAFRAFAAADSIMIIEYGIKMPECFEWRAQAGDALPTFQIGWARASDGANLTYLNYDVAVPLKNTVFNFKGSQADGKFIQHYSLLYPDPGVAGKFYWGLHCGAVSMVGVPDSLNGTTQYIEPFVKVQHQLAVA